ncbi:acetoin utilization protein AcuA [Paenibacillus tyrfis]|uniref:GNAT family N-acetyltransferase n=1 Tax=Paenibacillus tyrfis TaxID=1501230 RepID=UPI002492EF2F|nr:GNAT family N-acetyltransferase [Paenibacillus tyrfis]GLI09481.1 acetoin utilization protein AcuA [Paenibacillus tyrfis]
MEHPKLYHSKTLQRRNHTFVVEGPVSAERLQGLRMHPELKGFRRPEEQHEALMGIAALPEGRIVVARNEATIVGYVTFHYPDESEPWSAGKMDDLLEFGAIEVAASYRSLGLGKEMLQLAFAGGQMEHAIVFATEYYGYWDLANSKLDVWEYRKMTERLMQCIDMVWYATDDPEICSHPANCLLVRVGKHVPLSSIEQFDRIRFRQPFMY